MLLLFSLLVASAPSTRGLGINLGNVLEAPHEGDWAPAADETYFEDYVSAGFSLVRVPVRWDKHAATSPPYAIDGAFLSRVVQVVGWGLSRNLTTIVNSHHDDWIDSSKNYSEMLPRFLAIWKQVASAFASAPQLLRFEVLNEPVNLTLSQLNDLYAHTVPIMRSGGGNNAEREIYLGGLSWMSACAFEKARGLYYPSGELEPYPPPARTHTPRAVWIISNPDAVVFPPLPDGSTDAHLRLETHSYDPYKFCLQDPPTASSWGTPADVEAVQGMYKGLAAWSSAHQRALLMGEGGCQVGAPSRADRLKWYATVGAAEKGISDGLAIWDDDGSWKIYNRGQRTWDEGVLQALGLRR